MSTPILTFDQTLMSAARQTKEAPRTQTATLPVYFKVTRRLNTRVLSLFQRLSYTLLCRYIRHPNLRVPPPVTPLERGGFLSFDEADAWCVTSDDQITVMPWGWAYAGDVVDQEVTVRPRDTKDKVNARLYQNLKRQYGDEQPATIACPTYMQLPTSQIQELVQMAKEIKDLHESSPPTI